MANVTYLLGAGASYDALPIVSELTDAIGMVIKVLKKKQKTPPQLKEFLGNKNVEHNLSVILKYLSQLLNGCLHHISIDTYLKMLYLTKNPEYDIMKTTISCFFELYHNLKEDINTMQASDSKYRKTKLIDNRYDAFLASILLDSYDKFPENIRILSYNYDDQFERAYFNYLAHANTQSTLPDLMNIYRRNENIAEYESDKFSFFKVNGSANFFDKNNNLIDPYSFDTPSKIEDCIAKQANYLSTLAEYQSAISFAWDSKEQTDLLLQNIRNAIKRTNVLVVIGYSFPFFNRNIDKEIFTSFEEGIKIIIQDPQADEIAERVISLYPQNLKHRYGTPEIILRKNTSQFYLPNEL